MWQWSEKDLHLEEKAHRNQAMPRVVPTEPLLDTYCLLRVTSRLSRDVTGWQSLMRPDLNSQGGVRILTRQHVCLL